MTQQPNAPVCNHVKCNHLILCFLFAAAEQIENILTQEYCKIPFTHLPIRTVATAVTAMCQYCSTVTVCHSNPVTISVHTVTNMYGSHSCYSPQLANASSLSRLFDDTQKHYIQNSSGRVISPTHRPLPDNTQHSQQTRLRLGGIRTRNTSKRAGADGGLRPGDRRDLPSNM